MRKLFTLISIAIGYLIKTAIVGIAIILIIPDPVTIGGLVSLHY